jgi:antitoxin VapB
MSTAKVFKSRNSQAVRLPKEFQFDTTEVEIFRRGDEIVLRKKARDMTKLVEILRSFPDDFMKDGREDAPPQEREDFCTFCGGRP